MSEIIYADNMDVLSHIPDKSIDLIYIDPPFNTGKIQKRTLLKTVRDEANGDRIGFNGRKYRTKKISSKSFSDSFDDFIVFMKPRFDEAYRILKTTGSFFLHIDYREVHHCKVLLDGIFKNRDCFINEIIWAYDYGGRPKNKWPAKHDNILWYAKSPKKYTFNYSEIDRIPYMAPTLVGEEKAKRGKTLTDTWWHTIVHTSGKEKTGYPTQKPLGIIKRIIKVHSNKNDLVLDFFAGSGTTGLTCLEFDRNFILIDNNIEALKVMSKRFPNNKNVTWFGFNPRKKKIEKLSVSKVKRSMDKYNSETDISSTLIPLGTEKNNAIAEKYKYNHIRIIAIGVSKYEDENLKNLKGPEKDLEMIRSIFSKSCKAGIGLYKSSQIQLMKNLDRTAVNKLIADYSLNNSAPGDVLIFYFSGHGCAINGKEFGFCLSDTKINLDRGVIATTALSFSQLLKDLRSINVNPIFIIDSCMSGKAKPSDVDEDVKESIGNYGISCVSLCSCADMHDSKDTSAGGVFTKTFFKIVSKGLSDGKLSEKVDLYIPDIFSALQEELKRCGVDLPNLYQPRGISIPDIPICKNKKYLPKKIRTEKFYKYFVRIIDKIYNKGKPIVLTFDDIRKLGFSEQGNHSKLSLTPWNLLKDGSKSKTRELTKKGVDFAKGKLKIPEEIYKDDSDSWKPVKDTKYIDINDFK